MDEVVQGAGFAAEYGAQHEWVATGQAVMVVVGDPTRGQFLR